MWCSSVGDPPRWKSAGPCASKGPKSSDWWSPCPFSWWSQAEGDTGKSNCNNISREKPKLLTVMQWNAESVSRKKSPLADRLHKEKINISIIQETHLTDNMRFFVRGYEPYREDRQDRHKGGVLFLVRNDLVAKHAKVDTQSQAEISCIDLTVQDTHTQTRFQLSDQTLRNVWSCQTSHLISLKLLQIHKQNFACLHNFS